MDEIVELSLDAQVAERVMGWKYCPNAFLPEFKWRGVDIGVWHVAPPPYSTRDEDAREVIMQMEQIGWHYDHKQMPDDWPEGRWWAEFTKGEQAAFGGQATAATLEEAICRAALAALDDDNSRYEAADAEAAIGAEVIAGQAGDG